MPPFAIFGIESSGLNDAVGFVLLFLVVVYCSLVYWTYADARRRIVDPMLIGCATAASLFPFVGTIVYMILRPPEYLDDVRERELEMQASEARLNQLDQSLCPHCDYRVERDFVRCPSCLRKLKERCVNCSRPLDQAWTICPYCEADVPGISTSRTRRRRPVAPSETELTELEPPLVDEREPAPPVAASEPSAASARVAGRARRPRPSA
jgi:Double zinc ribbon